MKRSTFLKTSASVLAGSSIIPAAFGSGSGLITSGKSKPIRFAHLTDIHLKAGLIPESGMAKAFQYAQRQKPAIDFIVNGGDSIMDSLEADKEKTRTQWELFHKTLKNENSSTIYHCIGNHDVWGWFVKENKPDQDKLYGKVWVVETLELKNRFYSFSKGKWHFIILDSTQLNPAGGYIARLDPEQLDWLQKELASVPAGKFICIISHIPILSICAGLFFDKTEANGDLLVKRNLMHTDFLALKKIFIKYPAIRACISGHIHLQDEVDYLGIRYFCNGAVSGNWWKGSYYEFPPAFAIMELYDDGTVKRTMMKYD